MQSPNTIPWLQSVPYLFVSYVSFFREFQMYLCIVIVSLKEVVFFWWLLLSKANSFVVTNLIGM